MAKWHRKIHWLSVALLMVFLTATYLVGTESVDEICLNSGEMRKSQRIWGVLVKTEISETYFSALLGNNGKDRDWRTVNVLRKIDSDISPHYMFHGAPIHIYRYMVEWKIAELTDSEQRKRALEILGKWKASGHLDIGFVESK